MTIEIYDQNDPEEELVSSSDYYKVLDDALKRVNRRFGNEADIAQTGDVPVLHPNTSSSVIYSFICGGEIGGEIQSADLSLDVESEIATVWEKRQSKDELHIVKSGDTIQISNKRDTLLRPRVNPLIPYISDKPLLGEPEDFTRNLVDFSISLSKNGEMVVNSLGGVHTGIGPAKIEIQADEQAKRRIALKALKVMMPEVSVYMDAIASGNPFFQRF